MDRAQVGHRGEAAAARYYQKNGYLLLGHNYRTRMGELDLILLKEQTLVFAEVKTRRSLRFSAPAEAVDAHKRQRLIMAAQQYLQDHPFDDWQVRFDVVEVVFQENGWHIHCIPDAFTM